MPLLSASYGRYVIGGLPGAGIPLGVGMNVLQSGPWRLGIGVGSTLGKAREAADSPRLAGLSDINGTLMGSLFGSYEAPWFALKSHVLRDLGGKDQGTRISVELEGKYRVNDQLMLTAGPELTWADGRYTQTFFGVTAAQSASSGLAAHSASSGINSVKINVGAHYKLTQHWGLGARWSAGQLRGDAANSPITEKKSQSSVGGFANYRF